MVQIILILKKPLGELTYTNHLVGYVPRCCRRCHQKYVQDLAVEFLQRFLLGIFRIWFQLLLQRYYLCFYEKPKSGVFKKPFKKIHQCSVLPILATRPWFNFANFGNFKKFMFLFQLLLGFFYEFLHGFLNEHLQIFFWRFLQNYFNHFSRFAGLILSYVWDHPKSVPLFNVFHIFQLSVWYTFFLPITLMLIYLSFQIYS